jgi:murein DD-endopeptidase MepM/ murein hydrolase activator NlpD
MRNQQSVREYQSVASGAKDQVFGKRSKQHVLILASGNDIRHMTIRPWMLALGVSFAGVMAIGYLAATSYLVFRDDLIGASTARQARIQHAYEDRIAALRAQVDRITSRQLLDQQVVEEKVDKLLKRQQALTSRHGKLDLLLERASADLPSSNTVPVPAVNPRLPQKQAAATGAEAIDTLLGLKTEEEPPAQKALGYAPLRESMAEKADQAFSTVSLSLKTIESEQLESIRTLTAGASETANAIAGILKKTGIPVKGAYANGSDAAIGGPYIPAGGHMNFENSLNALDGALARLETMRDKAREIPFANPEPGRPITSRFGTRKDPFLGTMALHAGVDFQAPTGTPIHPTAPGRVIAAGWAGGYGQRVEIDHGNGITTRYGHMSKILAHVGQVVDVNDVIGQVGSTGRSTGSHLHYEIRKSGQAVDPMPFIVAGRELKSYLD